MNRKRYRVKIRPGGCEDPRFHYDIVDTANLGDTFDRTIGEGIDPTEAELIVKQLNRRDDTQKILNLLNFVNRYLSRYTKRRIEIADATSLIGQARDARENAK